MSSVTSLFEAECEGCGAKINADALIMSASMIVTVGQATVSACPECGSKTFVGTVAGLTKEEEETVKKNEFFSTLKALD